VDIGEVLDFARLVMVAVALRVSTYSSLCFYFFASSPREPQPNFLDSLSDHCGSAFYTLEWREQLFPAIFGQLPSLDEEYFHCYF
jgi:hypothetical protein